METYPIPMVPGPVKVPRRLLEVYRTNYGSADLETAFFDLYGETESRLKTVMGTEQAVVIQSGEGMLALWSALKSCLAPGDRVLAIATGVFGYGIADMARSIGAEVEEVGFGYDETVNQTEAVEKAIERFNPKMITMVHCETPSGTLNPIDKIGKLKKERHVPLLYVDAVASVGGAPVMADAWNVDLCLGGSQKCLSALPNLAFLSVSDGAWEIIDRLGYVGYDALKPFRRAVAERYFPYTHNWHGIASLNLAAKLVLDEGLANSFARHEKVAAYCRRRVLEMGLSLFPASGAVCSPTVTAVNVPDAMPWPVLDGKLRQAGLVVAGSYGPLKDKVFRLGHMGSQADMALMTRALDVLQAVR